MRNSVYSKGRFLWLAFFFGVIAGMSVLLAHYARGVQKFPYQWDSREAASLSTTIALKAGLNPWAPENAPQYYNAYGVLFPGTAAALLPRAECTMPGLRALVFIALLLSAVLVGWTCGHLARSAAVGAAAGIAQWGCLLFFVTPLVRSDGFAVLFFVAPFAVVTLWDSDGAAVLAAALAVLGFFCKNYVVVAGPIVVLVYFLSGNPRRAWRCAGALAVLLPAAAWAVEKLWPGYLEGTLFLLWDYSATIADWNWVYTQSVQYFFSFGWPLFALAAVIFMGRGSGFSRAWWTAAGLIAMLLSLSLGRNTGAYLTYYLQLLEPLLLIAVAASWSSRKVWILEAGFLLAATAWPAVYYFKAVSVGEPPLASWRAAEKLVAEAEHPLVPSDLAVLALLSGKPIADNGLTKGLEWAGKSGRSGELRTAALAWRDQWDRDLADRKVDLWIRQATGMPPMAPPAGYRFIGRMVIPEYLNFLQTNLECDFYRRVPRSGPGEGRRPLP